MNKLLPNQVYAGLMEILRHPKYYYNSSVNPDYSHFTEEGEKALLEFFQMVGPKMLKMEEDMLDQRAKDLVIKELKK